MFIGVEKVHILGVRSVVSKTSIFLCKKKIFVFQVISCDACSLLNIVIQALDQVLAVSVTIFFGTSTELRQCLSKFVFFPYVSGLFHCVLM